MGWARNAGLKEGRRGGEIFDFRGWRQSGRVPRLWGMRFLNPVLVLLTASVLAVGAGCRTTPEARIAKTPELFSTWPADVQAKIRRGEVELFFTPAQVELARGKPDRVGKRTTAATEEEVWIYDVSPTGWSFGVGVGAGGGGAGLGASTGRSAPRPVMRVVFSGGMVSAIERVTD